MSKVNGPTRPAKRLGTIRGEDVRAEWLSRQYAADLASMAESALSTPVAELKRRAKLAAAREAVVKVVMFAWRLGMELPEGTAAACATLDKLETEAR